MQRQPALVGQRYSIRHLPRLRKSIFKFIFLVVMFAVATPALADYLGPDRTVTETTSGCKVVLYECQFVASKGDYRYHRVEDWSCSSESKPWQAYPNQPSSQGCFAATVGDQYWGKEETIQEVTITYPSAVISSSLQDCTMNNGWCVTSPRLSLSGSEPVSGHNILAIEGTLNGQAFACPGANCSISLNEGNNSFNYWSLSSWGDSSTMGTFSAKVDSQPPRINGSFTGTLGSKDWYISPVYLTASASDDTSGLASFTCTLDGIPLGSCNSINIKTDGPHTVVLTARDNAGQTATLSRNTSLDTQNPILSAALNGTMGSNNWYTAAALDASASDPAPGSGLAALEYSLDAGGWMAFPSSGVLTLPEGKHTVEIRAVDVAGRTVSSSRSFWLDTTAPKVTLDPTGTSGSNGWYTTSLNLAASASDGISGMDIFEYSLNNSLWTTYTTPLALSDGTHSLSFWAQDNAGLADQLNRVYKVDTRVPQISGSLSGVPGTNGWYVSNVILAAAAFDPAPGSGIEAFTYILNGEAETPYIDALSLSNGQYTVKLNAQDEAGLTSSAEQTIKVDTIYPLLNVGTTLPNWIKDSIALNGSAGDSGSGLSKVEISTDGGQTWQPVTGMTSWGYTWNTQDGPNGIRNVQVRAIDHAGLITKRDFSAGVDNRAPKINLPDLWYQWDTVELDIWDDDSGLSEARVEISDPAGRWPTRIIRLELGRFPLDFKWDRRFGDDTIAPLGTYDVKVIAFDHLGNTTRKNASINILLDILPAGPTASPQPTSRPTDTVLLTSTPTVIPTATATQTAVISVFGVLEPTAQVAPVVESFPTPRTAPTQTNVLDWLQSVFLPNPQSVESVTDIVASVPLSTAQPSGSHSNVLWGAAAAAVIGSATAYALEEKRKREEEQARQAAQVRAEVEAKNAAIQASQQAKWEALKIQNWLQGQATLNAHIAELKKHGASDKEIAALKQTGASQSIRAAIDSAMNLAGSLSQSILRQDTRTAYQEARVEEETKFHRAKPEEWEADYNKYMQQKAVENWRKGEQEYYPAPEEKSWWENTKSFVWEDIIQPLNLHFFQPFVKPALEKREQIKSDAIAWVNENVYQRIVKPAIENTKQFLADESAWINEVVYRPHIAPFLEKTKQFVIDKSGLINEKVYRPHIEPFLEKTEQFVINESAWINEHIYQPHIKPALRQVKESVYQPYIEPFVDKGVELIANDISWINENVYQPFLEPVISDINQYIYQPLVRKATNWWENYGEWVHGALDAVGFIPGLGEIADGLNGLIYLGEGRYLEASLSAMSMIPLIGDLGKAGKLTLELGQNAVDKVVGTIAKGVAGEAIEKAAKESLEQVAEKTLKQSSEWVHTALGVAGCVPGAGTITTSVDSLIQLSKGHFLDASMSAISMVPIVGEVVSVGRGIVESSLQRIIKEAADELREKVAKEAKEEILEKLTKEGGEGLISKSIKESGEELAEKATKGTLEESIGTTVNKVKKELKEDALIEKIRGEDANTTVAQDTVREQMIEKTPEQVNEAQFPNSLRERYDNETLDVVQKYGDTAANLIKDHGKRAVEVIDAVGPERAETLLKTLDADVLDYVVQQGRDEVAALSRWSEEDLQEHGVELALRAKKDAQVLSAVEGLIASGPIDPKNLTNEQKALIDVIAANSTQYADGGQVVLGKWVDYGSGFVEHAQDTGSVHYNPHPDMWSTLGALENRGEVAWLINQQVVQRAIDKGLPIEYTFNGIPDHNIEGENAAILAVFSGKSDAEILLSLRRKDMPIRIRELQELQKAGYELAFDKVNKSYILIQPSKGRQI